MDIFDSVTLSEEISHKSGFDKGFVNGQKQGLSDGASLGIQKGEEIGSEIGFYKGFVVTWQLLSANSTSKEERKRKSLDTLASLLDNFDHLNPHNANLQEDMQRIQAKYKQVCSLLKINLSHQETVSF